MNDSSEEIAFAGRLVARLLEQPASRFSVKEIASLLFCNIDQNNCKQEIKRLQDLHIRVFGISYWEKK